MDFQKRFQEIAQFLQPYQRIWQNEIMLLYPEPLKDFPKEWIDELSSVRKLEDILKLEKKDVKGLLKTPSLLAFYQDIERLSETPGIPEYPSLPEDRFTFLYTIPKKQHEIRKLAPFLNAFYHNQKCQDILDIGGGIGLLAQTLNRKYHLPVTSLDLDPILQKTGRERRHKNLLYAENKVTYQNVKVDRHGSTFLKLLNPDTLTVGLHTCGSLAVDQLSASAKNKVRAMVNFGCCYQKLGKEGSDQNISAFAGQFSAKLVLSNYALTLASRAHKKMDEKDYALKLKVKTFRYALHFLLYDNYGLKEMVTLGNSPARLYDESFGHYALEQFKRIGIVPKHTLEELNGFYQEKNRQDLIWKMLSAGHIRDAFGRLLELYLLLDRGLYLEENGYTVNLLSFFNEEISPRNLGLVGFIKN